MKFFLISKCGEGAGLLYRIMQEGNSCRIWIREPDYSTVYDGILEKAEDKYPDDDEIVIFDSSGMGDFADYLKASGRKVLGASRFADKLENDRAFGLKVMEDSAILVPLTKEFSDFESGIKYAKEYNGKLVFKPCGDLPSKLSYVSCDSQDCIDYMKFVKSFYGKEIESFVLQEFIEGAIVSSEFWFDEYGSVGDPNQTIEVKKLLSGDLGPSTGCSGNIVWSSNLNNDVIQQGIGLLDNNGHVGPIDLNTIVNESGVYGLEWTPRFGLDALPTFMQLLKMDLGELIAGLVNGDLVNIKVDTSNIAAGIRVSIPPYPIEPKTAKEVQKASPNLGAPIRGLDINDKRVYLYEVMKKDNKLVHSDGTGVIAVVSDLGRDVKSAFRAPYRILEEAKIPDKQYRDDLISTLDRMHRDLKEEVYA